MNNDVLRNGLGSLERKIGLLLTEHQKLKSQIAQLTAENASLRTEIRAKEEQIDSFQNKIKISKIVNSIDSEGRDNSELKRKIDVYIKEIDKCIAHVGK
jgi:regulator of replication initiation timing